MKKAKKKRRYETEEDSHFSEKERIFPPYSRQAAGRRYRLFNPRRAPSGGGRSPPGGYVLHHNFRYSSEAPAYKVPKPQYSSPPRREPERPYIRQRYVEKPVDEKTLERVIRRVYKDLAEKHELTPKDHPEAGLTEKAREPSDSISLERENGTEQRAKRESEEAPDYVEEDDQELIEAEVDPEQLLDQLEANPTEELHARTLAELNAEPKFYEEEIEGAKIETNRLSSGIISELTEESLEAPTLPGELEAAPREEMLEATIVAPVEQTLPVENPVMAEPLLQVESPLSEIEMLTDVQDLMLELEPEIAEEEEEVEPSY